MNRRKLLSGIIVLSLLLLFFAFTRDASSQDLSLRYLPPGRGHVFGCDSYGRDLLSRLSQGALLSVAIGLTVSILSTVLGLVFAVSFFERGIVGNGLWMLSDTMKSIPSILLALFLSAVFRPGIWIVITSLTIANVPNIARTVYLRLMVLDREEFVLSSRIQGMGRAQCFMKHMLPHFAGELMSQSVGIFSSAILTEASLSFLGCGIPLDIPSIGGIMNEGRRVILTYPHMVVFPAAVLFLLGLSLYLIQDASDFDSVPQ